MLIGQNKGFDFLGWNFRKYNGKLLIKPSRKSIDSVIRKISNTIKGGKAWTQENIIRALNPVITGLTNYHQSVVSKDIFSKLDYRVWNMLWSWEKGDIPKSPGPGLPGNIGIVKGHGIEYFLQKTPS